MVQLLRANLCRSKLVWKIQIQENITQQNLMILYAKIQPEEHILNIKSTIQNKMMYQLTIFESVQTQDASTKRFSWLQKFMIRTFQCF